MTQATGPGAQPSAIHDARSRVLPAPAAPLTTVSGPSTPCETSSSRRGRRTTGVRMTGTDNFAASSGWPPVGSAAVVSTRPSVQTGRPSRPVIWTLPDGTIVPCRRAGFHPQGVRHGVRPPIRLRGARIVPPAAGP